MKLLRFVFFFMLTVTLGGAALGASVALLAPAAAQFEHVTAYGPLLPQMDEQSERSYMYDVYGNQMTTLFLEDRQPVALADVPQHLVDAVIAIEDRKFYEHDGVDLSGIVRALRENLDAGGIEQGASTITQQLVKNTMSDPKRRDFKTKAREAILARRLENELDKDEILERYLNIIYLGNGAYGVQAAAERYFGKQPAELTLGESALIAGLIQAPEDLNPVKHPDAAARRRALVLDSMVDTGRITAEVATAARREPLPTTATSPLRSGRSFFEDAVLQQLLNDDPAVDGDVAEHLGTSQSVRYNAVFRGGLRIHTTLDPFLQSATEAAVRDTLPGGTPYTAAVAVLDNASGAVRAMYPGRDYAVSQFNPVTASGRQTGSTFKGITLAAALERGYSPDDRVSGGSITVERQGDDKTIECSGGTMTLSDAIARSNNCAFVRTLLSLGPGAYGDDGARAVIDMAGRLGIDASKLDAVPTLTLGVSNTNVLDMAEAFSVFANEGVRREPIFVTRVVSASGDVVFEAESGGERVLDQNLARTETQMLRGVIDHGTGRNAAIGRPAAGKTGTTDNNSDAWFVGFTPQLTTAVWMGDPVQPTPMVVGGVRVQGGNYPARIWSAVMRPVHADREVLDFVPPDAARWPTAQRVTEAGRIYTREFLPGAETTTTTIATETTVSSPPTSVRPTPTTASAPPTTAAPPPTTAAPPPTTVASTVPPP